LKQQPLVFVLPGFERDESLAPGAVIKQNSLSWADERLWVGLTYKKTSSLKKRLLASSQIALICQKLLLPELAPKIGFNRSGCRGFTGPVPLPLWMSTKVH
jgi:hypothetical protein